jgi:dihydrofolate reductase
MILSLIFAMSENRVIGKNGGLPWHIPEDFAWFKKHTLGHPVVMGRKTFESIGRVLPKRDNIILTRREDYRVEGACICSSLERALDAASGMGADEVFLIGGYMVFQQGLESAERIYLTKIHREFDGDVFFPAFDEGAFDILFVEEHRASGEGTDLPFTFYILQRNKGYSPAGA